jgi:hypothetical protein
VHPAISSCIVCTGTDELIKIYKKKKNPGREREREQAKSFAEFSRKFAPQSIQEREETLCGSDAEIGCLPSPFSLIKKMMSKGFQTFLPYCRRVNDVMLTWWDNNRQGSITATVSVYLKPADKRWTELCRFAFLFLFFFVRVEGIVTRNSSSLFIFIFVRTPLHLDGHRAGRQKRSIQL